MLRVKLEQVARRGNGLVATGAATALNVYERNTDGTNGAVAALWDAATGGGSTTAAVQADANGAYPRWVAQPGIYNIVETLDGVVMPTLPWNAVAAALEPWIAMTPLLNVWVIDAGNPPGHCITSEGLVILRGRATHVGASSAVIYTLPAGYRPDAASTIATAGCDLICSTNGDLAPTVATASEDVRFENIRYRAVRV